MDDYIKRSDAVHALCKAVHKDDGEIPCENQTASCLWNRTRVCDYAREIDALPSADVVEVVRCKDCRHGDDYYHEGDCYCLNPKWGLRYFGGSWEFYCADAERKDGEQE